MSGVVGDPSPVLAVNDALIAARAAGEPYDEVIVSTLPLGVSRWLHQDVLRRIARAHPDVKVTQVAAQPALAGG